MSSTLTLETGGTDLSTSPYCLAHGSPLLAIATADSARNPNKPRKNALFEPFYHPPDKWTNVIHLLRRFRLRRKSRRAFLEYIDGSSSSSRSASATILRYWRYAAVGSRFLVGLRDSDLRRFSYVACGDERIDSVTQGIDDIISTIARGFEDVSWFLWVVQSSRNRLDQLGTRVAANH